MFKVVEDKIRDKFATGRGLIRLILGFFEYYSGTLSNYRDINWKAVKRLVFVCLGNINRSAYAEYVAKRLDLPTVSFGLSTTTGGKAFDKAILIAHERNIDLTQHLATNISDFRLKEGDLLVPMEIRQARQLKKKFNMKKCQMTILGLWSSPLRPHLHDPYEHHLEYFRNCFDIIDSAVTNMEKKIR